jgi:transposase InsO family protein
MVSGLAGAGSDLTLARVIFAVPSSAAFFSESCAAIWTIAAACASMIAGISGSSSAMLKREPIRRKVYRSRDEARQDVFDYIEMFYNPKRKHVRNGMLSPVEFEKQQKT